MPEQNKSIVWLHLSDLHFCKAKSGYDMHRVIDALYKDLKTMQDDYGLQPQLMFFTGDAAFGNYGVGAGSTLQEQYQDVEQFLTKVRRLFTVEIPKDNLFLVPGNHDVDRNEVTDDQALWLGQQGAESVNSLIKQGGKQWQRYMERLAQYRNFLERYEYTHLLSDPERLIYHEVREVNGVKIGIGGFNSAWSCGKDQEKGKLWLGCDWQNGTIIGNLKSQRADFKLALIHHPPGWFVEHEDHVMRRQMERDFDFFLHGHEHQGWVNAGVDGHIRISAAASYERADQENGYNFVRLNLESGDVEVWLRKYDSSGGGWIPRIIGNGKTTNDGMWLLKEFPRFKKNYGKIPPKPVDNLPISNNVIINKMNDKINSSQMIDKPGNKKLLSLFYSYAHEDESYRIKLEKHLSNLRRQNVIQEWHDRKIIVGQNWADEIDENLLKADVVLLLISADFISSDYCYEVEMQRALERHEQGLAKVIPILLRATDLEGTPFAKLQGLPANFNPVAAWNNEDEAYLDIVKGLRKLIKDMQVKPARPDIETINIPLSSEETIASDHGKTSDNSVPNDEFACKVRDKVRTILSTGKPAALGLRKVLLKDQPQDFAPEDILIPKNTPIDPEASIRVWRKQVVVCLQQTHTHTAEIKQCASEIMGWLILLCVDGIHAIDFDKVNEIVVPYKKQAGIEVFVARLQQRSATLLLKGHDKVDSEGHIVLGDIELGFLTQDRLLEIKRSVYTQVFPEAQPDSNDDWVKTLRKTIKLRAEDDHKLYYFSLPVDRRSEFTETIKQLKECLPELQILITGTLEDGSQSIGIMAEGELEALILHFLTALAKFS